MNTNEYLHELYSIKPKACVISTLTINLNYKMSQATNLKAKRPDNVMDFF